MSVLIDSLNKHVIHPNFQLPQLKTMLSIPHCSNSIYKNPAMTTTSIQSYMDPQISSISFQVHLSISEACWALHMLLKTEPNWLSTSCDCSVVETRCSHRAIAHPAVRNPRSLARRWLVPWPSSTLVLFRFQGKAPPAMLIVMFWPDSLGTHESVEHVTWNYLGSGPLLFSSPLVIERRNAYTFLQCRWNCCWWWPSK